MAFLIWSAGEAQPLHIEIVVDDAPGIAIHSTVVRQELSFGTFYLPSGGGSVSVPSSGQRGASGNARLIASLAGTPAVIGFESTSTNTVTIEVDELSDPGDGNTGSLALQIDSYHPASSFTPTIGSNEVRIGGTITALAGASVGSYSGSFRVTLRQQ
jgi:hypothetical protein